MAHERDTFKNEVERLKVHEHNSLCEGCVNFCSGLYAERDRWKQKAERMAKLVMDKIAFKFTDPQGNLMELITTAQQVFTAPTKTTILESNHQHNAEGCDCSIPLACSCECHKKGLVGERK